MPSQRRSPTGLWVVVLTTMPTIVSTVFFLLSALLSGWSSGSPSDDPFRELSAAAMARLYAVAGLFFVCYFGAAYGPVMLPIAAVQAARLTHKGGWR